MSYCKLDKLEEESEGTHYTEEPTPVLPWLDCNPW